MEEKHQIRLCHFENPKPTIWIKQEGQIKTNKQTNKLGVLVYFMQICGFCEWQNNSSINYLPYGKILEEERMIKIRRESMAVVPLIEWHIHRHAEHPSSERTRPGKYREAKFGWKRWLLSATRFAFSLRRNFSSNWLGRAAITPLPRLGVSLNHRQFASSSRDSRTGGNQENKVPALWAADRGSRLWVTTFASWLFAMNRGKERRMFSRGK